MPKENNKMQVDIDTLKKQNVNDLLSIKELYKRIEELGEKITQIKYIDNTLVKKLKKEYENFKKIILDENIQLQLENIIDEFNIKLTNDIELINSKLETIVNKGTTVEVLERVTKEEIERQIADGTIANLTIADGSIALEKLDVSIFGEKVKISNSLASWAFVELLRFPTISDSSDFEIEFKITPSQDIKQFKVGIGSVTSEAYTLTKDVETVINFSGTSSNLYRVAIQTMSAENIILDGIYENISLKINGEYISYTISTSEKVTMLYNEKSYLVTDKMLKNEVNNIKNISANKVTFGDYSMPVSLNQRKNLVEIFNNDFMIDKYIKTNCTIGTSNVTINQKGQLYYDKDIATDTYKIKFDFKVSDLNTKFGYITEITWNDKFSKTLLDCSKNTITTSFPSEVALGFNKPDVVTNLDFNIQPNTEYTFLVYKNGLTHTISIFDKKSGKKTSQELNLMCAWGIGKNGIACEQGSVNITNYGYSMTFPKYAEGIFIGDSITEGIGMGTFDISKRWCSLIRDNYFNGNALIFGKGYDISTGALKRLKNLYELNIKSKYVFIMIGTNDSANGDDGYNTWVTNINNIYNLIIEHGAIPIIICPPLTKKPDQIKKMRNYILSNEWNTIRMDIALSKNQDGETYDSTNFTDGVHPNIDGAQKMYERALYDLEMIM